MPDYNFLTVFEEKRSEDPLTYLKFKDVTVGEYYSKINEDIEFYEKIIEDCSVDPDSKKEKHEAMCIIIVLKNIKKNPSDYRRYDFIESILRKLEENFEKSGISYDLTDTRIGKIYDQMVSSIPIDQVLSNFIFEELVIYDG